MLANAETGSERRSAGHFSPNGSIKVSLLSDRNEFYDLNWLPAAFLLESQFVRLKAGILI
jgi:hypothetical protein